MPPLLALTLSFAIVLFLLAQERRINPDVSPSVWIPFLWMLFIGTRFPSLWLDLTASAEMGSADDYLEGSLIDQLVFLALYVAGLVVLARRRVSISAITTANVWIALFLLYCLLSVAWADYPWTALKRFVKVLEHVVMVLVILTDKDPARAMDALFRRFFSVSLVMSVVLLKYFPEIGRGFDQWSGESFNKGITTDKNALGHICTLGAVFFTSSLLFTAHRQVGRAVKGKALLDLVMLATIGWLLSVANAKTALVCAVLGAVLVAAVAVTRIRHKPAAMLLAMVSCAAVVAGVEWVFDLRDVAFQALERDATLTDRTYVWADVLAMPNNALLGTGFESFWLGPRLELLWAKYWWRPNQAHNGYIETYINLGAVGLTLLVLMMAAATIKALAWLADDEPFGSVRLALLLVIAVFNYTDATFKAVHILYFTFFLMSVSLVRVRAFNRTAEAAPLNEASRGPVSVSGPT